MKENENWIKSHNIIIDTLSKYELGDAYFIIKGLDLIGYENKDFWLKLFEIVKKYKGIESLVTYIDIMEKIGRKKLKFYMSNLNNKEIYPNFEDLYLAYINILLQEKKISDDSFSK